VVVEGLLETNETTSREKIYSEYRLAIGAICGKRSANPGFRAQAKFWSISSLVTTSARKLEPVTVSTPVDESIEVTTPFPLFLIVIDREAGALREVIPKFAFKPKLSISPASLKDLFLPAFDLFIIFLFFCVP